MGKSKTYSYEYDDYENGKNAAAMAEDILADPEFPELEELIIGGWGGEYEEDCQPILNAIADNPDKFSHITKLFVGDMDFEVCEVSWIMQGDYSRIWKAMPQLKELTIKGSMDLALGEIAHDNLESLTIICGGLGQDVMEEIRNAKLPNLKKLLLYVGVEDYGFDGNADTIKELLARSDFPKLTYLGIVDSEIQDELTEVVLESKYIRQIETLDLSCGTLTDKGGNLLLEKLPALPNIKKLDVHHHYLSDEVMGKLEKLSVEVDVSEQEEAEKWNGKIWYSAMLTE
ncbi:MAG: STM4015 family protein [Blautia sp.]|nr:STM4015 family protein [Blautia sp.]